MADRSILTLAVLATCLVGAVPGAAVAQSAIAATRYYKVVEHGQRIEIDHLGSLDPDCRSRGVTTVSLLSQPQGGEVGTQIENRFPNFVQANVRSRCDTRRLPSTVIYYRARPDFVGSDSFDVEILFPAGVARKVRYGVSVR